MVRAHAATGALGSSCCGREIVKVFGSTVGSLVVGVRRRRTLRPLAHQSRLPRNFDWRRRGGGGGQTAVYVRQRYYEQQQQVAKGLVLLSLWVAQTLKMEAENKATIVGEVVKHTSARSKATCEISATGFTREDIDVNVLSPSKAPVSYG